MFEYVIRRLLLMIPTFLGTTFLVFFILQVAPDGPFERAVRQLKEANMGSEGGSSSGSITSSQQLTPELLNELRMQYGLDKPIIIRYLIWLGLYPKEHIYHLGLYLHHSLFHYQRSPVYSNQD